MAFTHGKNAAFSIDNGAGSLTDISQYTDTCSLSDTPELADVTAFGDDGHRFIPGLRNGTFSAGGSFDDASLWTVLTAIAAKTVTSTFEYGPAGSATGKPKVTGECWLSSLSIEAGVADKVTWSAEFQIDDVPTYELYS